MAAGCIQCKRRSTQNMLAKNSTTYSRAVTVADRAKLAGAFLIQHELEWPEFAFHDTRCAAALPLMRGEVVDAVVDSSLGMPYVRCTAAHALEFGNWADTRYHITDRQTCAMLCSKCCNGKTCCKGPTYITNSRVWSSIKWCSSINASMLCCCKA
eukprot:GHRR01004614.1.p1 GENE.GHRR01004614.1~~GHRR01004614.1.p1  ORF type:complete len:155 (-),score=43.13 GHRR01004614.1:540-1004(-)